MALVVADRVKETTTSTGTGTIDLAGAVAGFQTFVAGVGDTNTTYYAIIDPAGGTWEVGIGTVTDSTPDTLSRDAVLASSNSGSAVNFGAGNKNVFSTQPADKAVYKDSGSDTVTIDQIQLEAQSAHPSYSEGLLWYDSIHNTLNYYGDESGLVHEVGIEEHQKVYNNSGVTINKGQPMYFSGNFNGYPTVGLANATDVNKYNAQGIAAHSIENNTYGYVCTAGLVEDVDTSGLSAGTNFFVGLTDGAVQNASPTYPNYPMCLGWVVNSDASSGILLVNQQNHSVNSFRVRTDTHIGGDLIIDGDLTVVGSQTIASSTNVETGAPFLYLNSGDSIGQANTTFTGSGLDDAYLAGHFSGTASTTYYVKIDATGTPDTFSWSKDNFSTTEATGVAITGGEQTLDNGIKINFGATTGHTLNDVWSGTATPVDVDTGIWSNRNTGGTGVGYTHVGMFFDVTDSKFKLVDEYDPEPTGVINTGDSSYSAGSLVVDSIEASSASISGNITVTGTVDGRDIATDGSKLDGIEAGATADQTITLSGDATGSGTTSISVSLANNSVGSDEIADGAVGSSEIAANAVGASELNVSGNGTATQFLRSDGDGTFTWATPTDTNTTYSAGSGLSLTGTTFANTAPDQTVSLTGSGATTVTGTYPNFTISSTDTDTNTTYSTATSSVLGLVKIGYTENGKNYPVELSSGQMYVNVPWVDTNTTYSVGDGGLTQKNFTTALNTKLAGIEAGATADQTASEILTAIKTVDGSGSGLDADTVDGNHASAFALSSHGHSYLPLSGGTITGDITASGTAKFVGDATNALALGGLSVHGGRNNQSDQVVRTNASGYLDTGWINTTSGDRGATTPTKIYASNDDYIRYYDLASFRSFMNVTAKTGYQGREQSTTDQNYWVGTMGWGNTTFANVFKYGSGSIDTWNSPSDQPSTEASHWVGSQHLHYTNSSSDYGHQIVVGAGNPAYMYVRGRWATTNYAWAKMWNSSNDGSGSGLDADTLDGVQGASFLRSDTADTCSGDISFTGGAGAITITNSDIRSNATSNWTGNPGTQGKIQYHSNRWYIVADSSSNRIVQFRRNDSDKSYIDNNGKFIGTASSADNADTVDGLHASAFQPAANELTWVDQATGNYGTIKVDDDRGVTWAGYAIRDDWVFMSDGATNCGIYNDTDNEWAIYCQRNNQVQLRYDGSTKLATTGSGIQVTGNVTATGDVTAFSDIRLKENVQTIDSALDKVLSMRGVTYTKDGKDGLGVIAQEVEEVLPEVVTVNDDEINTKSVAYGNIVGVLIEAMKEQQTQIDTLKSEVMALKGSK